MRVIESIRNGWLSVKAAFTPRQSSNTVIKQNLSPSWEAFKDIKAYKTIDDIFSIVHKLAKTAAEIKLYGYNAQMEDLPETDKLTIFLQSFTYRQRVEMYTWLFLKDECFIYPETTLGVNGTVEKVHFLNPNYITLAVADTWPIEVVGYKYFNPNEGVDKTFLADEIIHIKGFNPSDNYVESLRGLSRITVLAKRLTRVSSNMDNSVAQMQNGGVPGVMYIEDLPHNASSKQIVDAIKSNYAKFAGNPGNKGAPFIQAGKFGYFATGSELVDMQSIAMENVDFKKMCNVWGISDVVMNSDAASTESNVVQQIRLMYTNAVFPMVRLVEDDFQARLIPMFGSGVRLIKHDFDGVPEMQQSLKDKVDALAAAPVMIPNDVLEAMGYDRVDDPTMDQPLIKTGYEPIDNFEPLPPIE